MRAKQDFAHRLVMSPEQAVALCEQIIEKSYTFGSRSLSGDEKFHEKIFTIKRNRIPIRILVYDKKSIGWSPFV